MVDQEQELHYRLEMWDDRDTRIEELIALVADHGSSCCVCGGGAAATRQGHYHAPEVEGARR